MNDISTMVSVNKKYFIELRRHQWTNDVNLNSWYKKLNKFLIQQVFGNDFKEWDNKGNLIYVNTFTLDQKLCIINLDKSAISLDGINGGRGGRPNDIPCTRNICCI